jgi:hypothetical protein
VTGGGLTPDYTHLALVTISQSTQCRRSASLTPSTYRSTFVWSQILRHEPRHPRNPASILGPELLGVVEREDKVRPAGPVEHPM